MKWVQPTQGANVQGTVSGHGGRQRAAEHPGEVPGRAGPLRGPRPGRRARRRMPRGVPAAGVGAHGGEAERAVALQQRGPRDQPALRLAREGRRDGRRGGWVIDGTVGMGGHAEAVLRTSGDDVRLLGIDVDPEALARARARLARYAERVTLARADFRQLARVAGEHGIREARAVLLDLGVSSYQLDESGRGFSFQQNEPLDMRLDPSRGETAADLVNHAEEAELARLLYEHGGERFARRIARVIVRRRPLRTTGDLVAAVRAAVPRAAWPKRTHVATRTFQ